MSNGTRIPSLEGALVPSQAMLGSGRKPCAGRLPCSCVTSIAAEPLADGKRAEGPEPPVSIKHQSRRTGAILSNRTLCEGCNDCFTQGLCLFPNVNENDFKSNCYE